MELENYTVLRINIIESEVPISLEINSHKSYILKDTYKKQSTAIIVYDLPFVYNEFKMICLMTIFRFEGVSFQYTHEQSSLHKFCMHYKGFMLDYKPLFRYSAKGGIQIPDNKEPNRIDMTILLTETELRENPKFKAISV